MDFSFTKEQEQFRMEVRQFLEDEMRSGTFEKKSNYYLEKSSPEFSRKLAARGWLGMTWPKEYGGGNRSYMDRAIFMEEILNYQPPLMYHFFGERQIGPALIHYGSDEQKREFLTKIINAEISFCLGISEPGAGSDVAAISTVAKEEGDYFIINGQKIWTTNAHNADYIWLVVVTNPGGPKYRNMSEIIVDLKLPGITVRPLYNMIGVHCFNEVFFEDVKVHKKHLVGEKNKGFHQVLSQVDYERGGFERLMQNYPLYEGAKDIIRKNVSLKSDPVVRDKMAALDIELELGRLLVYHVAWVTDQGRIPNREAAISKHFCTRFEQKLGDFVTELLGQFGQVMPGYPETPLNGDVADSYLWSPSYTIQGGTSEILKTVIATRGLDLIFTKRKA
ncbi:MAG TPA: acyl-CoA dehydrogenase [Desulfotomaculum sp.]|jgi:alkylation response protein AidB-like acyl-CoA dehydrogenase|nr:acyl-CoA dehydrogenase [Desulfotomaculum sp.]